MTRYFTLGLLLLITIAWLVACTTPHSEPDDLGRSKAAHSQQPQNSALKELSQPKSGTSRRMSKQDDKKLNNIAQKPVNTTDIPVNGGASKHRSEGAADSAEIAQRQSSNTASLPSTKTESAQIQQSNVMGKAPTRFEAEKKYAGQMIAPAAPVGIVQAIPSQMRLPSENLDRENYAHFSDNPVLLVAEHPVSTFSIDVDTGSYTNTRRILNQGRLPAKDAVRVEEFVNYFNYDYPAPKNSKVPFSVVTEMGPTPWNSDTYLLHIGIKGYEEPHASLPASNLVFLVDVSGSMQSPDKLALLKKSLQMLTQKLRAEDTISVVVYAGASGVVLEPTSGSNKADILQALQSLSAGGSTNGAAGIRLAYLKAQQAFKPNGINRVILATDGDFNVGTTNFEALKNLVEEKRNTGIFLTTLGFGTGNYNDKLMEQLADVGNGNYAYIDSLMEAQKVLINEMGSTLHTIAKDVKIQIEFNPNTVAEYRLVGYENRALRREDFNNDKIDAGEIGAGHTVTAIYEISLAGGRGQLIDPLRYQAESARRQTPDANGKELAFLRLRYKQPDSNTSLLMETSILKRQIIANLNKTSERYRFAASVAGFGQLLRGGRFTHQYSYQDIVHLAVQAKGLDRYGYRSEFVRLVELADTLSGSSQAARRSPVIE